jgi:hypothetical protein
MSGSRARVALLLAVTIALPTFAACRRREAPPPPSPRPSASAHATAAERPPPRPSATPVVHGCRILGVKGPTPPAPGTPPIGTLLRGAAWLDVQKGVELDLKHTETTRELRLIGPGRFLACGAGAEAVLVARGSVTTTPGPGSRAGAEVELATPFGVVRYADAALRLDVGDQALELAVTQGSASVSTPSTEGRDAGAAPEPVRGPKGKLALRGKLAAAALAAQCAEARARIARPTAASVPSALPERGAWAVSLLQARKSARLVCGQARAAAGRAEGSERDRLEDQLMGPLEGRTAPVETAAPAGETDAGK